MSAHTPEPWFICTTEPAEIRTHPYGGIVIGETIPNAYNAERAVACVNACAGMTDPAAEITKLRADLETAQNTALRLAEKADAMGRVIEEAYQALDTVVTKLVGWHGLYEKQVGKDDEEAFRNADSVLVKLHSFLP